ncbi:MFS transporter small subunit [Pseudokineococcus sp. 1T1Z-3]|uniref:MFS transporter small subunit n=1 Tax=Pseudokineococcus sp. 1T1Z-3 TaxID=3132745 RepID=UPI003099EE6B
MSSADAAVEPGANDPAPSVQKIFVAVGWTVTGVPLVYGLVQTVRRALTLFTG